MNVETYQKTTETLARSPHKLPTSGSSPCELCGGGDSRVLYPALPLIRQCRECGLIFHYPQPSENELKELYGEDYFISKHSAESGYDNYLRDEENISRTAAKRLAYIEKYQPDKGRLLEIGCATGFFLKTALSRGWDCEGIEFSGFASAYARSQGLKVMSGSVQDYTTENPFDVIALWDVIEHVPSPRKDLLKMRALLKPGGTLVLATPAVDSLTHYLYRDKWMGFKDVEHLYFFSRKTLSGLLQDCGFQVKKVKWEGKYISLDLLKRRIGCYSKFLSNFLRKRIPAKYGKSINFYINSFDIQLVVAQKI